MQLSVAIADKETAVPVAQPCEEEAAVLAVTGRGSEEEAAGACGGPDVRQRTEREAVHPPCAAMTRNKNPSDQHSENVQRFRH